jgi:hypothetical protein
MLRCQLDRTVAEVTLCVVVEMNDIALFPGLDVVFVAEM